MNCNRMTHTFSTSKEPNFGTTKYEPKKIDKFYMTKTDLPNCKKFRSVLGFDEPINNTLLKRQI